MNPRRPAETKGDALRTGERVEEADEWECCEESEMSEPENLTPAHLRCPWGQCQSIHRLADGKLFVVAQFAHMHPPGTQAGDLYEKLCDERKIGDDEAAVIISPELLGSLKAEWVSEAMEAAARRLCPHCGKGNKVVYDDYARKWEHAVTTCHASGIWEMLKSQP